MSEGASREELEEHLEKRLQELREERKSEKPGAGTPGNTEVSSNGIST